MNTAPGISLLVGGEYQNLILRRGVNRVSQIIVVVADERALIIGRIESGFVLRGIKKRSPTIYVLLVPSVI